MSAPLLWWVLFNLFLLGMLALDLGVFHRKAREVRVREALAWTGVWVAVAMAFNVGLYFWLGSQRALEFLTGYLIEKALAVDNIFVFVMIFSYFQVPPRYQHKVLFWGVLGALVMRAGFIFAGVELIHRFHGMIYVFGGLLILTGLRMLWAKDQKIEPERNSVLRLVRRLVPVTERDAQGHFFVRHEGRWMATPLLLVLILVEISDLIFAVDSIPAILAITLDPFLVYTSNALAILGLRSLYFALAGLVEKFAYLHYGLAAILVFVGAKMLLADVYKLPTALSLGVIVAILVTAVLASLLGPPREPGRKGPK